MVLLPSCTQRRAVSKTVPDQMGLDQNQDETFLKMLQQSARKLPGISSLDVKLNIKADSLAT